MNDIPVGSCVLCDLLRLQKEAETPPHERSVFGFAMGRFSERTKRLPATCISHSILIAAYDGMLEAAFAQYEQERAADEPREGTSPATPDPPS